MRVQLTKQDLINNLLEHNYTVQGLTYSLPFSSGKGVFEYEFFEDYFIHRVKFQERLEGEYKCSYENMILETDNNQVTSQAKDSSAWFLIHNITDTYLEINKVDDIAALFV